jgi:glyceraldehyde 3-phosphate dehydrogenase
VLPRLNGKLNGYAMRVPVSNGSILDLVVNLEDEPSVEELNGAFAEAAEGRLSGILGYTESPVVSSDIVGNSHSSTVDGLSTMTIDNMAKVFAWYDNEWGTANRVLDVARMAAESL